MQHAGRLKSRAYGAYFVFNSCARIFWKEEVAPLLLRVFLMLKGFTPLTAGSRGFAAQKGERLQS